MLPIRSPRVLRALGLAALLTACRERPAAPPPVPPPALGLPGNTAVVVLLGEHDTLDSARQGLAAALRLKADLPLPYPRVERHGDRFRVVLARGKLDGLRELLMALRAAGTEGKVLAAGEAGGDDVVRLGIVCTEGEAAPLYAGPVPQAGTPQEIGRLPHGEVVVPAEDEGDPEDDSPEAERGFLRVLAPKAGLVRGADVLLPADCTPRDEDNDDGNGRLLSGGRLCLTTRFSGRDGDVARAALVAVAPSYRRCQRFPEAGTFDGFDQSPEGTQFAVEATGPAAQAGGAKVPGIAVYDVAPAGQLTLRTFLPGLARPAYLSDRLVAVTEDETGQALVVVDAAMLKGAAPAAPRRIFSQTGPRFQPEVPTHRPAAPTLLEGRVVATFQQGCQKADERRVRAAARGDFEQCVLEVEVDVGLDGAAPKRRCHLNNSPSGLEQPITVPCR